MINLEQYFRALAYKKRFDIYSYILENGECSIEQIIDDLKLPYETIFRNLSVLRSAGFIESRTKKMKSLFKVNTQATETVKYLTVLMQND